MHLTSAPWCLISHTVLGKRKRCGFIIIHPLIQKMLKLRCASSDLDVLNLIWFEGTVVISGDVPLSFPHRGAHVFFSSHVDLLLCVCVCALKLFALVTSLS